MSNVKPYETEGFYFEFSPNGNPYVGTLRANDKNDRGPYAVEINLEKSKSRKDYAADAAELYGMDQNDLKRALNEVFTLRQEEVLAAAQMEEREKASEEPITEEVEALVASPGVLNRYVEAVAHIHGVVKDREPLQLQTLGALGAQLAPLPNGKPAGANLILMAVSGRGKNHICDAVASPLPEEFVMAFESASAKSLYYKAEENPEVLKHRWIYPNEAEATDQLVEMFRPLLSGGKATHLTVNATGQGRNASQELNVEGPVSITIPTVRNKLDTQLQTRMLVAELTDYPGRVAEHSREVSRQLLPEQAGEDHGPRIRAWQTALRSLTGTRRVVFHLQHAEFCFDSDEVSHGARIWGNFLGLMQAHAWLEQRNRDRVKLASEEWAIVATPEDYEAAYAIFKATCERSVVNLSDTHRKILTAVHALKQETGSTEGFSHRKIADKAGVHHSTVGQHRTYLVWSVKFLRETESGMLDLVADAEPSWWNDDDLLEGFPHPEKVWRWWKDEGRSAPEPPRQALQLDDEARKQLTHTGNSGGHPARHSPATIRHAEETCSVADGEVAVADKTPATESRVGKQQFNGAGPVVGMAGTYENGKRETSVAARVATFLQEPPHWYKRQVEEYVRQGAPERLLKPLASAAASHVLGNAHRWTEILPHVEAALREGRAGEGP
jgi:hypothetical protein